MYDYNELLNSLPIDQLASRVGESPAEVESAVRNALPTLLMGMGANAQDPAGEASLRSALSQHDPSLVQGGVDLGRVDPEDGRKITHHIFGSNEDQVINQLGGLGGGNALIQKLLPILAPIVMSWLAGKLMGRDEAQSQTQQAPGGGGLGDILGQILGGGQAAPQQQAPRAQQPKFRTPDFSDQGGAEPQMRMPEPDAPRAQPRQDQQAADNPLGGGVLGQILGGLLGGGRR
ncbi:DUF937 domain-containing protein [Tessaracoccus flavus]|uniref:Uncharacterized protein n=1 Tax=Tessaracoccus flavus TaxID=1610493 RepID=A0A1Q2CE57_9ACTN|nr:DUF937 domain-containing protein [Tessaracoccus flavus]AQP44383.1 hypothetical protein RPIT_05785 [Tessaracoccus flavus]SDY67800.1 hypothetical protein SAMN05428934_103104 [Tessaracoccus flavus]